MKNFWEGKNVLVTGGTGFIGSNVISELMQRNASVTVSVHNNENINFSKLVKIEKADLKNLEDCLRITKNKDIVLNFAALDGGTLFKKEHSAEIFETNTRTVLNLLEASRLNKVDRLLLMSSIEVYSDQVKSPITEEMGFIGDFDKNKYGYAWSKRFAEIAAKTYFEQYNLKIAIARVGNVYGLGDFKGAERGRIIPSFIYRARNNKNIIIFGNANNKKSFLHIDDLVVALLDLTEKYPVCEAINIVSSEYISLKELAESVIKLSKSNSKIIIENKGSNNSMHRIIETKKARIIINFGEKINIKEGLKGMIYD